VNSKGRLVRDQGFTEKLQNAAVHGCGNGTITRGGFLRYVSRVVFQAKGVSRKTETHEDACRVKCCNSARAGRRLSNRKGDGMFDGKGTKVHGAPGIEEVAEGCNSAGERGEKQRNQ